LSDAAYFFDNVGATASYINMVVVDVTMVVIIGGGCATGAGCLPAIGSALTLDYAMTTYSPIGVIENASGGAAAVLTILDDAFVNGTNYITMDETSLSIGIGRDSVVSAGNALGGLVPEANFDAWVSHNQLLYDNARHSGNAPASTLFEITLPWSKDSLWGKRPGRSLGW
jgi:hypothetical protein